MFGPKNVKRGLIFLTNAEPNFPPSGCDEIKCCYFNENRNWYSAILEICLTLFMTPTALYDTVY